MRSVGKIFSVIGVLGIVALGILVLFSQEAPQTVASRFMSALAKGDTATLVELSYFQGEKESLRKQWDFAVKEAGPHYRFRWRITAQKEGGPDTAAVTLMVERGGQGYEDQIDLPMIKHEGKWKVDVRSITRQLFPALPR